MQSRVLHGAAEGGSVVTGSLASAHLMPRDSHHTCVTPPNVPRRCQPSCRGQTYPQLATYRMGWQGVGMGCIIFANEVTNKGLVFKIYKQLTQLYSKRTTQPNERTG